jgi:hypothetical protein
MVLAHCVGHGERAPVPFARAAKGPTQLYSNAPV